jgi:hypothetical protein
LFKRFDFNRVYTLLPFIKPPMKKINKLWGMALLAFVLILTAPHKSVAQGGNGQYISEQEFYDQLSPYGAWVSDPNYGDVWVPDVNGDFRPYVTNGHWVLTEYGNTWVSDYPWGWATFHYGRWHYDDYYGWEWVPGNEWAPAWVSWRNGNGYYGWAPLAPQISIEASFGSNYYIPNTYWAFAPYAYINQPNIYNYCVPATRVRNIYRNTTVIRNTYVYNNRTYIAGPRREDIQRYTQRPIRVYNINNINRPGANTVNNNAVNIYRPSVRQSGNARPARVIDGAAYRQQNPNQRIGGNNNNRGPVYNRENASKLANEVRSSTPDSRYVRVNNRAGVANPAQNNRPNRPDINNPTNNNRANTPTDINNQRQQQQQVRDQQRQARNQQMTDQQRQQQQQRDQQRQARDQQMTDQQRQQQQQVRDQQRQARDQQMTDQQRQQQQQVRDQQRQARDQQMTDQQRQQQQQVRDQQRQARDQQMTDQQRQQQQQVRDQQKQARDQQRQQQNPQQQQAIEQQRQAREQQRQQMTQQKQQADQQRQQQAQQQQRQQADQQRQQAQQRQQQQADQQRQQQAQQQQRQQADQQRQQAQQRQQQQADQQRQQQADQQRQQADQQRQQQADQQRQQQEQQKQQQQQPPPPRPVRP